MNIRIFTLCSILLLSGCAKDNLTLNTSHKESLKGKTIVVNYENLQIYPQIVTQGDAISKGMLYGVMGVAIGGAIHSNINSNKNPSSTLDTAPIISIRDAIVPRFIKKHNMKIIEEVAQDNLDPFTDAADEDLNIEMKLFHANYTADYILDIQTHWQVMYYKTSWGKYYVKMYNKLRLIDRKKKVAISSTICNYESDFKDELPNYEKMFENNAELMKKESQKAVNKCIKYIEANMLN